MSGIPVLNNPPGFLGNKVAPLPALPGAALRHLMRERRISVRQMALRTGTSTRYIMYLINGQSGIGVETALKLEEALPGTTAETWRRLQGDYDVALARKEKFLKAGIFTNESETKRHLKVVEEREAEPPEDWAR